MESRLHSYVKLRWNLNNGSATCEASPKLLSNLALSFWFKVIFDDMDMNDFFCISLVINLGASRVTAFLSQS